VQEWKESLETGFRSSRRRKALKGEAQERWGLKNIPKVPAAESAERVKKP
jgi:hypothetical protein